MIWLPLRIPLGFMRLKIPGKEGGRHPYVHHCLLSNLYSCVTVNNYFIELMKPKTPKFKVGDRERDQSNTILKVSPSIEKS